MAGASVTSQSVYLKNMAALWRRDAKLAVKIDNLPDSDVLPVESSKSGPATLAMQTTQGQRIWLHSRYDPVAEARKLVDAIDVADVFCFIVCGFGLGYHVRALFERLKGDAFIIVSEPSLAAIRTGLENVDLAELLDSDRCVFLTEAETSHVHTRLQPYSNVMMLGTRIVAHRPSQQVAGEFHATMCRMISDYAGFARMSLMTLVGNSRATATNIANNLPTYVATPPIDILRERFKGYPGVVVAAGPSLRRNIDVLAGLTGRAVICTVQTVFKTLLGRGITPDFVTSLDYHEVSRRYFEGIEDFRGVHLVAEPKATWHVVDVYRGPVSLLDNTFARQCLGDDLGRRGGLPAGATVAHLAFYLLQYVGCDPIIFVGQDLAFTDHLLYAPGASAHNAWRSELNRFNSLETKEWEKIIRARKLLRKVTDIRGHPIYTDEHMYSYLQQFESDFARSSARIVDASEGGVLKHGAETMTLAEAANRFCNRPVPAELTAYRAETRWYDASRLQPARARVEQRRKELTAFRDLCQDTLDLLRQLKELTDRPTEFNRLVARADEMRTKVRDHQTIYQMVSSVSQLAEFRRFSADRHIKADDPTGVDRARRQLARDIEFIEHMLEGCTVLDDILVGAIERFDRAIEGHARQ
jgi:hypothetical protein